MEAERYDAPFGVENEETNEDASREVIGKCPKCGGDMVKYSWGWGCESDKEVCGLTIGKALAGVEVTEEMATLLLLGQVLGPYEFTSKEGKSFKARIKIDEEAAKVKMLFIDEDAVETDFICPKCGKKLKKGKYNYQCECGFSVSQKISSHELTDGEVKGLLAGGTDLIEDFVSKAGKPFKAKLKLKEDDSIEFIFD